MIFESIHLKFQVASEKIFIGDMFMDSAISDISKEELYMKSGKLSKMATTLAVLILVMSGFMVVQWNAQPVEASEHEDYTYTIEGFLDTDDVSIESDLEIKLKSLSTGEVTEETTSEYFYEFTDVKPGWYEIILPSQVEDDIAYMRSTTDSFRVPEPEDEIPSEIFVNAEEIHDTIEGEVTDVDGEPIENALVTLEDEDYGFKHSVMTETEETEDNETISTYSIEIFEDFTGRLKVEKDGYAPHINTTFSYIETDYNVELSTRPMIEGNLVDETGSGIREEMDITLYNEETGMIHTTRNGPTFRIRAPAGYDYTLVVSAKGYQPFVAEEDALGENERRFLGTQTVPETEPEEFNTDIDFNHGEGDLNEIEVNTTRQIRANTRMETLDYSHIGHLSMQIDLTLGENNVEEFKRRLNYTNDLEYTSEFITVNDTVYQLENYSTYFSEGFEENITGDFDDTLYFNTTRTYTAMDEIDTARHIIDLTVENDREFGNFRDQSYTVDLIEGYERYIGEGTEQYIPENVEVENYTKLDINPMENGRTSDLTFDIRRSQVGEVEIVINNLHEPTIYEKEENEEFIVKGGTEVVFEAVHENPISQPVDFDWDIPVDYEEDDEDPWIRTVTFEEDHSGTVSVVVTESNGETVQDEVEIVVDVEGPDGYILVDGEEVEDETSVNEDEEIEFSAANITDEITGVITQYRWNFSDESEIQEGENVTHTFETPGEYDVTVNVTDAVGNYNEIKIILNVEDTTEPIGDFSIEWNDEVSYEPLVSIPREVNVTFNGTEIEAHPDYEGEVEFNWTLTDEDANETIATSQEEKWTYAEFIEAGEYTILLNVTDQSGNSREIEKTVLIERGAVPDLLVSDLRFSDENPRVGDTVTIRINVTNVGEQNATDITVNVRVNGELIDIDYDFYQEGEPLNRTMIESGEEITIRMEWEPENDGENTVSVNVTDANEPEDLQFDNELEQTINVRQAAWRQYLVYALIPIIIIAVTVGLYMFKDRLR